MSGHTTVRAGVDTFADQLRPSATYPDRVNLQIGGPANQVAFGFLYFHNPAPKSATIVSATLRFYGRDAWGAGAAIEVDVQRISARTKFSQLNWNNRPGVVGGVAVVSQPAANPYTLWEFDVTAQLQTIANGAANYGFRISSPSTTRRLIWSLSASHHRPTLEVVWSDAPQAPTSLVPSGGQVVSLAKPVLQFDYTDVGGDTDIASVQVQIDPAANWDTPSWDSGVVAVTDPELDLSQTSYPGLVDGQSRYWRVRVQDGAGLWSRWSARSNGVGAKMQRVTKGLLTLLSPGNSATVDDWTPPISWNFTGRTQQSWRVVLSTPDDPTEWIWSAGRQRGSDTAITIPRGQLTDWDQQYRVMVDVWDAQDRVATPGDPAYVRVRQDFTLVDNPGVAPANQLSGWSDPDLKPYMHLSWHRDDAPDAWNILRDNRPVRTGLYGPDLLTSTPEWYSFVDKDARPNVRHTWKIQAVVNGKNSYNPPTYTDTIHSDHAWLIDWDSDRLVAILDPDISFDMPEVAGTYEPVARNRVVRVTQQQRGMEGTVSGRIIGFGNMSVDDYESNLIWMKRRPTQPFRLMVGDKTWLVLLGDVVVSPMRIPNSQASAVSLSFWSLDGPPEP